MTQRPDAIDASATPQAPAGGLAHTWLSCGRILAVAFVVTFGGGVSGCGDGDGRLRAQDTRTDSDESDQTAPDVGSSDTDTDGSPGDAADDSSGRDGALGDALNADTDGCPSGTTPCGDHCVADDPRCACRPESPTSFGIDVLLVTGSNCSGCHGWAGSRDAMLATSSIAIDCSGSPFVTPYSLDESYIMSKMVPGAERCGDSMPPSDAMTAEQIDVVRQWICEGARPD